MKKDNLSLPRKQGSLGASKILTDRFYHFAAPILRQLMEQLDRRLVKTFFDLLCVIIIMRHRNQGLLLTELGGRLLGMDRAPAGAKRISNLLHSEDWAAKLLEDWMWAQGDQKIEAYLHPQDDIYAIWDESEIEKSESLKAERLCAVRSAKARRLKRIKPGYYNPPKGRPVFVPGFHWWTTRGEAASQVIHVWDRGFVGEPWLMQALEARVRFIVRWKKGNYLIDEHGERRKKRSIDHRLIYDCKRRCQRKTGLVFFQVKLPDIPDHAFWMVLSRPGAGRQPWFLLTNEPIHSLEDAWRIVLGYNRRWQIETSFRLDKSELAIESIHLLDWQARQKLMLIVALLHAFLLSLLTPTLDFLRTWLLDAWCHRTGKRNRSAAAPLCGSPLGHPLSPD